MEKYYLLTILAFACLISSVYFIFWIQVARKHQEKAYAGDKKSAKRIILPFYRPLIKVYATVFLLLGISVCLLFIDLSINVHRALEYYGFFILFLYSFIPFFLRQSSASVKAVWRTLYQILPWYLLSTLFWGLSFLSFPAGLSFFILFLLLSTCFPIFVMIGILTKYLSSRVQIGSLSNRNSTELILVYAILYGLCLLVGKINCKFTIYTDTLLVIFIFLANQLFPFVMYRTLIADTKFWRGLGKHNQGGLVVGDSLRQSGIDVHRPTMEMSIVGSSFQSMMADINDITVDFAYLQLERLIGEGATSKVFRGKLKGKLVAVKLSTPPEITEDVIDIFVSEARIASALRHRNIVQFLGICVRPPQVIYHFLIFISP
jgi:hypothetical protein